MRVTVTCLLCYCIVHLGEAQTGTNAKDLRKKLFVTDEYDKRVRSANDQSDPTAVEVNVYLVSIHELDEVRETLKTTGFLEITWQDDFLQWNSSDYGGLQEAFFPQDEVWKPDIALRNSMVEYKQLGVSTLNVHVSSEGIVHWYPFQVFQSSCSVNIKYFPFDIQTCKLKFVAWSYSKEQVVLIPSTKGIVWEEYNPSSEWDILSSDSTIEEKEEAAIIFTLTIRRKPRYLFLSIMFPIIMLSILNVFVFALPSDSGEKASYAVTVFLAFAVFLTIVSASLPENSDATALYSVYIIIQTAQSTLITILALIFIRLHNIKDEHRRPIPQWLLSFVKLITCKNRKRRCTVEPDMHDVNTEFPNAKDEFNRAYDVSEKDPADDNYNWKRLVDTLDWFFLVLFGFFAFLSTFLCFLLAYVLSQRHVLSGDLFQV